MLLGSDSNTKQVLAMAEQHGEHIGERNDPSNPHNRFFKNLRAVFQMTFN